MARILPKSARYGYNMGHPTERARGPLDFTTRLPFTLEARRRRGRISPEPVSRRYLRHDLPLIELVVTRSPVRSQPPGEAGDCRPRTPTIWSCNAGHCGGKVRLWLDFVAKGR